VSSLENAYLHSRFGIESIRLDECANGSQKITSSPPLLEYPTRMSDRLVHWARLAPERAYMAQRDAAGLWQNITYSRLLECSQRIGQSLIDRGLSAERPLLILSENDLDHALLAMAANYVGVPFAPISPAYSIVSQDFEKLRHVIQLLTPGLVYASDGARFGRAIAATVPADTEVVVSRHPLTARASTTFDSLQSAAPGTDIERTRCAVNGDTILKFLFTSGSTSLPKAVINTQRMLCSNLTMIAQALPFLNDEPPLLVDWLPWNHTFGGNHNTGFTLFQGGTLYIDDGKPVQPLFAQTLRNLRELSPTIYFNVPKGFEELARALAADAELRKTFFKRVQMLFYAGAGLAQPIWDSLYESAEKTLGKRVPFGTGLGMTETAPSALFTHRVDVASGMIGVPCAGVETKLAPMGDKLEIRFRGPSVMPGYWRMPQASADAFDEEGFYKTGDAVRFVDPNDPNRGFLFDGRIAEDFKLATGTWVSVGPLRAKVIAAADPYVQDVVVAGINRNELGLLIFPFLPACRSLANLTPEANAFEVLNSALVTDYFAALFERLAATATGSANRVRRVLLLVNPPLIDLGEITDKGSINQRAVLTARDSLVQALFEDQPLALELRSQAVRISGRFAA
jgi:feruloyl-CoA synthase